MGGFRVGDDELFIEAQGKRHRAEERLCAYCAEPFMVIRSQSRPGSGQFCSRRCARSRHLGDRFWAKVRRSDGCWEWQGTHDPFGYGVLGASAHQRAVKAHRVSWQLHNGPVPVGLWVLHHCDNPPCVRPDHLYLGTARDNAKDRANRRRGKEDRQSGAANDNAKLTEADVWAIVAALEEGVSQTAIAGRFGVKQPQISRIARRVSWRHLWDE